METLLVLIHLVLFQPREQAAISVEALARATGIRQMPRSLVALAQTFQPRPEPDGAEKFAQYIRTHPGRRWHRPANRPAPPRHDGTIISDDDLEAMLAGVKEVCAHPDDPFRLNVERRPAPSQRHR